MRIMIVDDSAFMRMTLKTIVEKDGHEVVAEAANGVEAVQKYQTIHPDVVTMDITMPVMDGIQAVRAIKVMDPNANIVMFSAMGQQAMVIEAIQAGARDFIVKPFDADRVLDAIRNVAN